MNSRTIVMMLALISLISTATGGYLYYHAAQEAAVIETERELAGTTNDLKDDIDRLISVNQNQVRVMARFEQLQKAMLNQDHASISQADQILDHFSQGLSYEVCYLMDGSGKTIASTNRHAVDSFVGHNYAFRPYFVDAIKGKPGTYLAVGVTSGMRGIYFSHPVYLPEGGLPIGVAVIKASTRDLDRVLSRKRMGVALLVHSSGIIFASSGEDLTLKLLWRASPEELSKISETQQFGKGPWNSSGLEEKAGNQVVDSSGEAYLMEEFGLGNLPGWRIVYLYSLRAVYGKVVDPLVGKTGYVALFLGLFVGGAVIVLYFMAQKDIRSRKRAEKALKESERRSAQIIEFLPDATMVIDFQGKLIAWNKAIEDLTGIEASSMLGKGDYEYALPFYGQRRPVMLDLVIKHDQEVSSEYVYFRGKGDRLVSETYLPDFCGRGPTWLWNIAAPLYDEDGRVVGAIEAIRDITDRKRAEEALRISEDKFSKAFFLSPDAITITRLVDGVFVSVNEGFKQLSGYAEEEVIGKTGPELNIWVNHGDRNRLIVALKAEGRVDNFQAPFLTKGGDIWYGLLSATIIELNRVEHILLVTKDITDRKLAEDALRQSEEKYRMLIETANEGLWAIDGQYRTTFVNQRMASMLGYSIEEMLGRKIDSFIFEDDLSDHNAKMNLRTQGEGAEYERCFRRKDGGKLWTIVSATALNDSEGKHAGSFAMLTDITERKIVELEFQKLALIVENSTELVNMADLNGQMIFINEAGSRMIGVSRAEVGQYSILDVVSDPYLDVANNEVVPTILKNGSWEGDLQYRNIQTGKLTDVHAMTFLVKDRTTGEPLYLANVSRDITDRKRHEEQLRELDKKTRLLIEQSPVGIAIFQDGVYCYANPELLKILNCENKDQILGEPITLFVAPGHQRLFIERCKRHIQGKGGRPSYQVEGVKRNGELFDMVLWPKKIDYEGQPAILAFVMDVTETKNLRNQLVRAQKMEAIGTLAGGIAHDFNNLLQVIVGYSELMMMNPALPDQFSRGIKSINKVAVNGAELVRRLLTFARKTESSVAPLILNDKIKHSRELLDRTLPKMIQIELKLSKDPTLINADASQIEQIIINLAVNAGHAMPEGGSLVIETKTVNLERAYCLDHIEATPGPYVLLSVSDTGAGIDKKTLERIFEPFFTTKGPGIGTGLGLSMVYGIVKQHGGHITCYSEPGAGTTLKIYFPAIDSEVKSEKPMDLVVPKRGTETILLVDDNESVRDLGEEMLLEYGYRVITASNGREALQIYSSDRENISLVILDLFMPEMGGKECLRALLRMDPKVRVLLVSGFTQNGEIRDALDSGARGFIGKPVDIPQFLEKIRKIIDEE